MSKPDGRVHEKLPARHELGIIISFEGVGMSKDEYTVKLKALCAPCLGRVDLAGKVEIVSLEWLIEMSDPSPSDEVDLGADKAGSIVSAQELARDIKKRGLLEPLVVAVGMSTGRARLEGGNHRVRILLEMGLLHAPAVCWVGASHVGFDANGTHQGRVVKLWPDFRPLVAMGRYDERHFERPSSVLPSAPVWNFDEVRVPRSRTPAKPSQPIPTRIPRKSKAVAAGSAAAEPGSLEL